MNIMNTLVRFTCRCFHNFHCSAVRRWCALVLLLCAGLLIGGDKKKESEQEAPQPTPEQADKTSHLYPAPIGKDRKTAWGYIDRQGRVAIKPAFANAQPFYENVALVRIGGRLEFVNRQGKVVSKFNLWSFESGYGDGMFNVCIKKGLFGRDSSWGYVDGNGKLAIDFQFSQAKPFSEGLAAVTTGPFGNSLWDYIDKKGNFVFKHRFNGAGPFSEGLAAVEDENYRWGYIDKKGRYVIQPKYSRAGYFSEGLAKVENNNIIGYIDPSGELKIPLTFENRAWRALPFSEGLAAVWVGKLWGYINKKGEWVAKPQFHDASSFSEGRARIMIGGEWVPKNNIWFSDRDSTNPCLYGFIDKTGKTVIEPKYREAEDFYKGMALVQSRNGKSQYIERDGKVIWKSK